MRGKRLLGRLYLGLLVFVLTAAAVAVPASWGRYTAQAQVQSEGRVAGWDVVWENNDLGAAPATVGLTQGAVVFHPGNWATPIPIAWTLLNRSEVAVTVENIAGQIQLKMSNPEPAGRHNNALRIGQYYHTGGWVNLNMTAGALTSPDMTSATYTTPTVRTGTAAGRTFALPGNDRLKVQINLRGYVNAPAAPVTNWTYGQNAAMHTLNMSTSPYWRTYRANAEIRVSQVD